MEMNNELIRSLGMALVHSLWEGLVILVLVLFALSLAGRSNARLRYAVAGFRSFFAAGSIYFHMVYYVSPQYGCCHKTVEHGYIPR